MFIETNDPLLCQTTTQCTTLTLIIILTIITVFAYLFCILYIATFTLSLVPFITALYKMKHSYDM